MISFKPFTGVKPEPSTACLYFALTQIFNVWLAMLYFTHGAVRSKWLHCWGNVVEKFSLPKSPPPPPRCVFRTADLQTNKWGQFPELFTLMISNNGPPPAPCKI